MPSHSVKGGAQGAPSLWLELRAMAGRRAGEAWRLPEERRCEIVTRAIEELDESAKLLLALRYYEGLGVAELSAALGLERAEVNDQLAAALAQVHEILMQAERTVREEGA